MAVGSRSVASGVINLSYRTSKVISRPYQPRDLLPGIELYGQNEIYEMTRDPLSRNRLIERFWMANMNNTMPPFPRR